ncbi:MAG: MBL fold metallo-hydrolase [Bacteroidota bacterium]|nr:MBL fold metallo-hydrolase [Candidatus Kapabacteria bacterium]MCS7303226.1 MBL fold metallo-hydrolase [Candidatus Kapabacteria bacterium]MCX7937200.1 MBL fold metallo-hydrolase [Chlorobiota bacterium]MDW8075715.1 MBL fold metallo-hydrolase [Bacteroidota bacterium]MDW8272063.1 MBL fold metallo-hydrolase [Bacteroidota bacterium]
MTPRLHLETAICGPVETNAYLVADSDTKDAVLIDAPIDSLAWYMERIGAGGFRPIAVWLTHSHWDHTADAAALAATFGIPVLVHPLDAYRLHNPNAHTVFPLPFRLEAVEVGGYVHHGDVLSVGNLRFEVRHVPGHTEGSVVFIEHTSRVVFCGDTLFAGSIGRTDLPGGDYDQLIASIRRELLTLPDDYACYPGHMEATTIGQERRTNPFLQPDELLW